MAATHNREPVCEGDLQCRSFRELSAAGERKIRVVLIESLDGKNRSSLVVKIAQCTFGL